jgi:hypothetical protein
MDPSRFDRLARSLAQPASRRTVGVLLGGALAGLAGVSGSTAERRHRPAKQRSKGGNSACAKFCAQVFGADTPEAAQCTSDAAHNNSAGLCARCNADLNNLCGTTCCAGTDTCGGGGRPGVCGCLTAGTCCADAAACQAQCCSRQSVFVTTTQCDSGRLCR